MNACDRILIDPPGEALAAAVLDAVAAVNRGQIGHGKPLEYGSKDSGELFKRIRAQPEGYLEWHVQAPGWIYGRQAALLVAWWSDYLGRKHFRVVGGCSHQGAVLPVPAANQSILACVHPSRCLFSVQNRRQTLLVFCNCGAWGTPEQVAWMGTRCGPCFDRQESEGVPLLPVLPCRKAVREVAFSPDGKRLAAADESATVSLWDIEQRTDVASWEYRAECAMLGFSPDGQQLAACSLEDLLILDVASGRLLEGLPLPQRKARVSPDRTVLVLPRSGSLRLWDIQGRRLRATVPVREPARFSFTSDSSALVILQDGSLHLHDVQTGLEQRSLTLPPGDEVLSFALSPCGRLLALGMASGVVRLWPAEMLLLDLENRGNR